MIVQLPLTFKKQIQCLGVRVRVPLDGWIRTSSLLWTKCVLGLVEELLSVPLKLRASSSKRVDGSWIRISRWTPGDQGEGQRLYELFLRAQKHLGEIGSDLEDFSPDDHNEVHNSKLLMCEFQKRIFPLRFFFFNLLKRLLSVTNKHTDTSDLF